MSVIVKGMKMPSECARFEDGEFFHCQFVNTDDDCILQSKVTGTWEEMYQNCPLVALPDHHGDLIDRNELLKKTWDADTRCGYVQVVDRFDIDNAPTIVESEGET